MHMHAYLKFIISQLDSQSLEVKLVAKNDLAWKCKKLFSFAALLLKCSSGFAESLHGNCAE